MTQFFAKKIIFTFLNENLNFPVKYSNCSDG